MKRIRFKIVVAVAAVAFSSVTVSQGALIITGLGDPDGGSGDILELFATTAIPDLSIYGIAVANNANSLPATPTVTLAPGTLAAGSFYYITSDFGDFAQFFGFSANEDLGLDINGNDTIGLFLSGNLVDRVLADADTTDVHADGWIYRNDGEGPNTTYTPSEWTITQDSLGNSNDETNAASTIPMPVGTYAIPEPSVGLLSMLGCLAFLRRRR